MSFELLDFVNELITEETLSLPAKTLLEETESDKRPSAERIARFRQITDRLIEKHQATRLANVKQKFEQYQKNESVYQKALNALPPDIEDIYAQIVEVVARQNSILPGNWTMAHREETTGKDHDEELKRIWIRMYMLGFIVDEQGGAD